MDGKYQEEAKACEYLILMLEKTPTNLIHSAISQNSHTAWTILTKWYKPSDTIVYTRLSQNFEMSILQGPMDNPEPRILDLISLNT